MSTTTNTPTTSTSLHADEYLQAPINYNARNQRPLSDYDKAILAANNTPIEIEGSGLSSAEELCLLLTDLTAEDVISPHSTPLEAVKSEIDAIHCLMLTLNEKDDYKQLQKLKSELAYLGEDLSKLAS